MGRYDRYILSQLLVLFGFFSLVLISVYWINQAIDLFETLLADGQNIAVFLEFTALSLPSIMLNVLPVAAFVAALYIFNRMISESEFVVLQTSGLGPLRLLRPVILFAAFLAVLIAIPAHLLAPAARTQFNDCSTEVSQDLAGRILRAGEFIHPTDGLTVFIREITELGEFRDLFLQDRSGEAEITYTAQRALLVRAEGGPRLVMFEGMAQTRDDGRLSIVEFGDFAYDLGQLVDFPEDRMRDIRELPTGFLLRSGPDEAERFGVDLIQMHYEAHDRIVRTLFAFFVPIIGTACLMLGSFSRFGVWPQVILAVLLMIPLQIISNAVETVALQGFGYLPLVYLPTLAAILISLTLILLAGRNLRMPRARAAPDPAGGAAA